MTTPKRPSGAPPDVTLDATLLPAPTPEELRAAEELRLALEDPDVPHEDAELLRTLALADAPRPIGEGDHRDILERVLAVQPPVRRREGRVIRVAFGVSGVLAIAAGIVLFLSTGQAPAPLAPLAAVRSTQSLFREPFAREGGESARVDRIALARATDFRDNEFQRWGVR